MTRCLPLCGKNKEKKEKQELKEARKREMEEKAAIRWMADECQRANSKLELSQLLFISIRQREPIKSPYCISLSTYTDSTWSVH